MRWLYKISEIWFAIFWITVYVVGTSAADSISHSVGSEKSVTFVFHFALCILLLVWLKKNGLFRKYGLCKAKIKASKFLYYIPLILISTVNLWFGIYMNMPAFQTVLYVGSMICVGFLEELIFRGFLFKAMEKSNAALAIIISAITFGIGHIVNLINGSGADVISNICQILYATAFGFLFVIIFHRGKSLLAPIAAHSIINALSAFSNSLALTPIMNIMVSLTLCAVAVAYTLVLCKTLTLKKYSDVLSL